jgi:hypothetical protein
MALVAGVRGPAAQPLFRQTLLGRSEPGWGPTPGLFSADLAL